MTVGPEGDLGRLLPPSRLNTLVALSEVYFSNNMLTVGFGLEACLLLPLTFHTPTSGFFLVCSSLEEHYHQQHFSLLRIRSDPTE